MAECLLEQLRLLLKVEPCAIMFAEYWSSLNAQSS